MAEIITEDEIDFERYEKETDHKQKVKPAALWVEELIARIKSPVIQPRAVMPWRKTHQLVQFRPGEVTVWGGANGQGKSLVTGQIALSLCAQGEKVCIASFEMKPMKTLERMGRQWSGENPDHPAFRGHQEAQNRMIDLYEQFRDWTNGRLWLYDQQGTVSATQVCAVVRYCAKERGITHFFVDSLMKCVAEEDDYNGQKRIVDELTAIARDYGIHIHLVHHIKKPANEDHKPTKYDYKGSGSVTDQVDNVISVWRNKIKEKARDDGKQVSDGEPDALLICDKQRHGEWEGKIGLWFHKDSMQYLGVCGEDPLSLYLHPED
ncbi:twinkle protein [Variovorax paradoxus]|uniref:DnaB-like helicase C-terminal domain-containing protein n=1 Tax=Variovorax paradoxus TaxID=34073 RepID=UPI002791C97F|nr:DnaB-like helicase C-terminal domain-containing protein [Variovorax paradoxus]MDQ0571501.1 twinkle protein [Variovorax paradoxus]